AAELRRLAFPDVAGEGDARHAFQHVADRDRLELLEEVESVGELRRHGFGAVAHRNLPRHHDLFELRVLGNGRHAGGEALAEPEYRRVEPPGFAALHDSLRSPLTASSGCSHPGSDGFVTGV